MTRPPDDSIRATVRRIGQEYSDLVKRHGPIPQSAGYRDATAQELRYRQLAELIARDDWNAPATVAELGCGYGAFYRYLVQRFPGRMASYAGYDVSEDMLREGNALLSADPAVSFHLADRVAAPADYVFLSGIFNVRLEAPEAEWRDHVRTTLRDCFAQARRGLAFYVMRSAVDYRDPRFFYADPGEFASFCQDSLSPKLCLFQDYPLFEWTMVIRR